MSAPETNIDKQVKRHRGPLYGMALAIGFAGMLFLAFLAWTSYQGNEPSEDAPAAATATN